MAVEVKHKEPIPTPIEAIAVKLDGYKGVKLTPSTRGLKPTVKVEIIDNSASYGPEGKNNGTGRISARDLRKLATTLLALADQMGV